MSGGLVLVDEPIPLVRRLTLNRPGKRNAMNNALRTELFAQLRAADVDREVRVIVLRGSGSAFCSGYDLGRGRDVPTELSHHTAIEDGYWPRHVLAGWFEMWDYATPVIAQVHGWCLAGGSELATACDLVYVADDAQIGYPPVRMMSSPDMAWHPWLLGMRRGLEAVLTGDAMTGVEAAAAGFATRSFPADELEDAVLAAAAKVAKIPHDILAVNKRSFHRSMEIMGIRDAMRAATDISALGMRSKSSVAYAKQLAENVTAALTARDGAFGDYRTTEKPSS
ncbi:crotonase/enoyl-CoA hydratase family protein [Sporichthya brevicatena]|uniref:Crotonase/enoyl-CoA hydratase family protein n=1 Tax=Sporichthya brevicatena TaxID=171442 RepID=A0ABP3RYP4_9ACTN